MKYVKWDTKTDLKLDGFEIEPEIVNSNLKYLTISRDGQVILKVGVDGEYWKPERTDSCPGSAWTPA